MAEPNTDTRQRKTLKIAERTAIQELLLAGELTHVKLAEQYGVSERTIRRLANPQSVAARKSTSSSVPISIRPTPDELQLMDETWQANGFKSRNHFLRHLVRASAEIYDLDPGGVNALAVIADQLRGVANNINQMTKAANRGQLSWSRDEKEEVENLYKGIGRLRSEIARVRNGAIYRGRAEKLAELPDG